MPKFYFDFENGGNTIDSDGLELSDLECAKKEAVIAIGECAADFFRSGDEGRVTVRIRTDEGPVLEVMATVAVKPVQK